MEVHEFWTALRQPESMVEKTDVILRTFDNWFREKRFRVVDRMFSKAKVKDLNQSLVKTMLIASNDYKMELPSRQLFVKRCQLAGFEV